ncbi:MAG: TonB family protein [bacterium]|nr:TonB family protein [bacterium]
MRAKQSHLGVQRRAQRKRDGLLALAALLAHAVLVLLLPAFSIPANPPIRLQIELAQTVDEVIETTAIPERLSAAPSGGTEQAGPTRPNQPLNRKQPGNPADGPRRDNVRPAAASPKQDTGKGHSPSAPSGNVKQTPKGESAPPKNTDADATEVGRGTTVTSTGENKDKAIADEVKPAPSKSAGVGIKPGAQQSNNNAAPGKARPGNGKGSGDSAGDGVDSKPSPNKGNSTGPSRPAQPQDGGQGSTSARPGKDGGSGPGGGPGKGEGPGGKGDGEALDKPAPPNNDAALMAAYMDACRKKVRMLARTPEVAKEQGHTGKVSFSFTVSKRGRLISVSVNGGVGFKELQEECREATRTASFSPFPAGVQAEQWTIPMSLSFPIT